MKIETLAVELERLREIHPEITSLEWGYREKHGAVTRDKCVVIGVDQKLILPRAYGRKSLPREVLGYPTDIQIVNAESTGLPEHTYAYSVKNEAYGWTGSTGPVLLDARGRTVQLTNYHVAPDVGTRFSYANSGAPHSSCSQVPPKGTRRLDAAVLDLFAQQTSTTGSQGILVGEADLGQEVMFSGGRSQVIKSGAVIAIGLTIVNDTHLGQIITPSFRFVNWDNPKSNHPIPGDSGSGCYGYVDGELRCFGLVNGVNLYQGIAVPMTQILEEFDLTWAPAPAAQEEEEESYDYEDQLPELRRLDKANQVLRLRVQNLQREDQEKSAEISRLNQEVNAVTEEIMDLKDELYQSRAILENLQFAISSARDVLSPETLRKMRLGQ
jgi:hypothetical protein